MKRMNSHGVAGTTKVLAFDVFGTVVDWHKSVAQEVRSMNLDVDGNKFALAWRAGYMPAIRKVMAGELGWTSIDDLHRMILDELLETFRLTHLSEDERLNLNRVWHRLDPWPDSVAGLTRLKSRYTICTLSNGNIGLLSNMAKRAALPWDCILSAEIFHKYKPDPATYLGVARIFDIDPSEVMMVAAHQDDLAHARACGLKTAYVERPLEHGPLQEKDVSPNADNTLHARDLIELADLLKC
ncbi:haloacid dehalogenase type II [Variovorax sp. WS11]|uniref:haloacid dehalogenase type II n=1 Tax=Variovorax sp. WS11 TaxID=1105204 RepID=UPI000D0D1523|nr:haloacid dehalogenase type II [Variovorax sp. WS11]NDZ17698.1 haloacid dehalogenase type II [Variovorax sp. WS11]PSL79538.1 haloacid dehalogenase type II [Variovorax sp. WS11]